MTDWTANFTTARWYAEVLVGKAGEDYQYVFGHSDDDDPNLDDLVPEGWTCVEETLTEIRPVEE